MERPVCIIVPVYNAFRETEACLSSVLKHSPASCRVLVIDDCSSQGTLAEFLPAQILKDGRVTLLRNEKNLGFVKTCNRGMLELSGASDVILLNSDTEVTARWVEKLERAARSRPEIATVTPLTNNGTICSYPRFCRDNELVPGMDLDRFADLVEEVSAREYPQLPTCVGFCTFIKRAAIDTLQGFDGEAFGRGYGEENDFSCRARKLGLVDVLDDATFIYHKGNMSFGKDQIALGEANSATLRKRHPLYFDDVSRFCREFPLRRVHDRISNELMKSWSESKQFNVLHVLHNGPYAERHHPVGGTERHVQDIIRSVPEAAHWSLTPTPTAYYLTAHLGFADREFILDRSVTTLYDIFKAELFDIIHAQHVQGFAFGELDAALRQHGNFLVSVHDFNMICPRVFLMTPDRRHCSGFECTSACSFGDEYITEYRRIARALLEAARSAICFSATTREYFERILKTSSIHWHVQPHGIEGLVPLPSRMREISKPGPDQPLKVAFLGFLPQHKGALLIEKLLELKTIGGVPVEWHIVGELYGKSTAWTKQHGKYERAGLPAKLAEIHPHAIAILSLCPETYSLTLDEAWNAGIPVISTPYGAPGERVAASGAGWVLPEVSEQAVVAALEGICNDWSNYLQRRAKVREVAVIDTDAEGRVYSRYYGEAAPKNRCSVETIIRTFDPVSLRRAPKPSLPRRIAGFALGSGIRMLERLRLRVAIERFAAGILPGKFLQDLKSLR